MARTFAGRAVRGHCAQARGHVGALCRNVGAFGGPRRASGSTPWRMIHSQEQRSGPSTRDLLTGDLPASSGRLPGPAPEMWHHVSRKKLLRLDRLPVLDATGIDGDCDLREPGA
jgi:hypothetical protein